jgi:phosphotransferase system IIB component
MLANVLLFVTNGKLATEVFYEGALTLQAYQICLPKPILRKPIQCATRLELVLYKKLIIKSDTKYNLESMLKRLAKEVHDKKKAEKEEKKAEEIAIIVVKIATTATTATALIAVTAVTLVTAVTSVTAVIAKRAWKILGKSM